MWCRHCKQEVAVVESRGALAVCPICEDVIRPEEAGVGTAPTEMAMSAQGGPELSTPETTSALFADDPLFDFDLKFAEEIRHTQALLAKVAAKTRPPKVSAMIDEPQTAAPPASETTASVAAVTHVDPPSSVPQPPPVMTPTHPWHATTGRAAPQPVQTPSGTPDSGAPLAGFVLLLGVAGLACGGALWWLANYGGRAELWTYGLPAAIGGQVLFLLGLIGKIDYLVRRNRTTGQSLAALNEHVGSLEAAGAVGPLPAAVTVHYGPSTTAAR